MVSTLRQNLKLRYIILIFLQIILINISFTENVNARSIVADLSLRNIEIDSKFKGIDLLLFGAKNDAGDIVVVVRGPKMPYIVRQKKKMAGIWINKNYVIYPANESFYHIAASRRSLHVNNDDLLSDLEITIDNLKIEHGKTSTKNTGSFRKAFIDEKIAKHLYTPQIGEIEFIGDTLFRTLIKFPENISRGTYLAEIYLFSDGQLMSVQTTPIIVSKQGFDAVVYDFAHGYPFLYGVLAVIIALSAGWLAGTIFRKV